jgi:hypothetical protein
MTTALFKVTDCVRIDELSVADESRDTLVASVDVLNVLSEPPPSIEFKVDAILCFDGVRRKKLTGREGAVRPGLRLADFGNPLEPAHNRPRNRDAAEPTFSEGETASATCASL